MWRYWSCVNHIKDDAAVIARRPTALFFGFLQQTYSQLTDNAVLYAFQISDDERMSLTTAISDDEIDHSSSPVSTRPINSAASFNCTGAVRKAGFLSVKKWIIRKKHKVELARKRGWKGYWVLQCFSYFLSWDIALAFLESSCNVFYELKLVKNAQNDLKML